MKISEKLKSVSGALWYSILGIAVMNGVIQLVLYPYLNVQLGAETFGTVLTLLSVVAIVGVTFGTGANYSRMLSFSRKEDSNGDYNRFLLYSFLIALVIGIGITWWTGWNDLRMTAGYYLLLIFSITRYYADVEFRLRLNYRKYCVFYILIALGYVLGVTVYPLSKSWILAVLLGEIAAVVYTKASGNIFDGLRPVRSEFYKQNRSSWVQLAFVQLITISVLHLDRILLQVICDGTAVAVFYAATLVGKMIALISTPLNSVLIGYLARYEGGFTARKLWRICLFCVPLGLVLNIFCTIGAYVFVKWMYADIFELVKPYLWLANGGQVFYFLAGTLMVFVMRFAGEKYQVYISGAYLAVFLILAVPMTICWGIRGMAWAVLLGNLAQILMIAIIGCRALNKKV